VRAKCGLAPLARGFNTQTDAQTQPRRRPVPSAVHYSI